MQQFSNWQRKEVQPWVLQLWRDQRMGIASMEGS
jgi:hypothetical protein